MSQTPPEHGAAPPDAAPKGMPGIEPKRRLHPLSPLLRGANLVALAIAAISWQGYRDLGLRGWLIAVAGVVVAVLAYSVISWLYTGYHVVGRELRVYEGWVWRRTRAIPLERLQSVEVVRPLLARAFGLAELRIEVVGAGKTEAPLAYLPVQEAVGLRERLLDHRARRRRWCGRRWPGRQWSGRRTGAVRCRRGLARGAAGRRSAGDVAGAAGVAAPFAAPERRVHVVANRDLVISQLLRPQWWALPLAIAAPIFFFAYDNDLTFIGVASTLTAIVGVIQAPVRVLLSDWRFTMATTTDELRFHRGLLETRHQTVSPARIQAVAVEWPLLWRGMRWVRAQMFVAGVARSATSSGLVRCCRSATSRRPSGPWPRRCRDSGSRRSPCTRRRVGSDGSCHCAGGCSDISSPTRPSSPAMACSPDGLSLSRTRESRVSGSGRAHWSARSARPVCGSTPPVAEWRPLRCTAT